MDPVSAALPQNLRRFFVATLMSGDDVNASSLLDFFSQLTSKSNSSISNMPIKEEPLTEEDLKALQKDRQKKDNHNLSKSQIFLA